MHTAITTIREQIAVLPPDLRETYERLLFIDVATGYAEPTEAMLPWVTEIFGSPDAVRHQTIVKIVNRLTLEGTTFSPLRALRPTASGGGDAELEARIAEALAGPDFFRDPLHDTTFDRFGRIHGRHCVTASNIAKFDGWHGLVLFDEPHPLRFDREHLQDYLEVTLRWFMAAHRHDPAALYPLIGWNCLPKSGATLMHGHMHLALARGMHYARVECWRRAAAAYRPLCGNNYFDDLYAIHASLGLALASPDGVRAFVHLTPLRNREVVFLVEPEHDRHSTGEHGRQGKLWYGSDSPSPPFIEALSASLHAVLRGLIDGQGMRAFNLAVALPPLAEQAEDWRGMPIVARVSDRGNALAASNDWGVAELYAMGCTTADPFEVVRQLKAMGDGDQGVR
jgi:hypothetical protein